MLKMKAAELSRLPKIAINNKFIYYISTQPPQLEEYSSK